MYLEHFGLTEAPFRITSDPAFFFTGGNRGATLDALLYAVTHDGGIVKVIGEVGCGKTMLCRLLVERLPAHLLAVHLGNPAFSPEDILHTIADELAVPSAAIRTSAILRSLQERLSHLRHEGKQVILLIDEAHSLSVETLEQIRLLSNREYEHRNLLQFVLFGQPELNRILARGDMRQLRERITHHFSLDPLAQKDVAAYLHFRLRAAGFRAHGLFNAAAVNLIAGVSLGLVRRVNVLADKSLLAAASEKAQQVARRHVRLATRDSAFDRRRTTRGWTGNRLARAAISATSLVLVLFVFWFFAFPSRHDAAVQPTIAKAAAPIAPAQLPIATSHAVEAPLARAEAAPMIVMPIAKSETLAERIATTDKWLTHTPEDRWFVQLLAAEPRPAEKVERFVAHAADLVDQEQLRVYVAHVNGNQRLGVIYGDYASREEATAAAAQLPPPLRALKPFPRKVKWLR